MNVLGIDIGTSSIKYVLTKKRRPVVSKKLPFSGDLEDIGPLLQQIRKDVGLSMDVRVLLTTVEIIKKTFTLPVLPKEELEEAAKWSLSKMLSEPLDEYIYIFGRLGFVEEKGIRRQEMYFFGAKREMIEKFVQKFEEEGFSTVSYISDVMASFIHIARELKKVKRTFAILDIGCKHTDLYIFRDGVLRMVREILTSGDSFTEALASGLNLSLPDAENYKREEGFSENLHSYLLPPFERLTGEIDRTIAVYNRSFPEDPCELLFLTGGGAHLKGLHEKLKEYLPISVERLSNYFQVEEDYLPAYFAATSDPILNLFPKEKLEWRKEKRSLRIALLSSVALVLFASLYSFHMYGQKKELDLKVKEEIRKIEEKRAFISKNAEILTGKLKDLERTYMELATRDVTFLSLLKSLSSFTPDNLYLKELNFERLSDKKIYLVEIKGISVGGDAEIESPLLNFLLLLERKGILRNPQLVEKNFKDFGKRKVLEFVIRGECEERVET